MESTTTRHPEDGGSIFGHRPGLFVLFFTEMWERFSYYGMRALLVLFLTSSLLDGGWEWSRSDALQLYGWYTGLVYLTPIIGGFIADKLLGYRKAVILGALIMTLGHLFMAFETPTFFYMGLTGLILGNGLFKPNISSIVGQLYKNDPEQKDGAYTIFYMGINAGAFIGILLCGYIGEKVGWSYGFGLAGIFMFLGMLQFFFAQKIFGKIGLSPKDSADYVMSAKEAADEAEVEEEAPANVQRDRIIVISIFAFFTVFFWWAFEQAGGSMTIFAGDYTDRVLSGGAATTFKVVNTLLVIVPLVVITWVLFKLFRLTFGKYAMSNIWLALSFAAIWVIALWLIQNDWNTKAYEATYNDVNGTEQSTLIRTTDQLNAGQDVQLVNNRTISVVDLEELAKEGGKIEENYLVDDSGKKGLAALTASITSFESESPTGLFWTDVNYTNLTYQTATGPVTSRIITPTVEEGETPLKVGDQITVSFADEINYKIVVPEGVPTMSAQVKSQNTSEIEIAASWFGILNSFFIIVFAPLFGRFWQTGIIKSGPLKFALGLTLVGIGFAFLAYGSLGIPLGAKTAGVSILWLILAYLFHTLGELCVSPVGLSYVSKLAPVRLVGLMFGIWFISNFIANLSAGLTGSLIDPILESKGLTFFFLIFTVIPIAAAVVLFLINGWMKKMMHGID
ncbi:peptide MFS transporter [Neolewinella persica]|uniref:peptide MFS transporter n=1 Tax=Neolewinella persica TaxID=70998 RepID=UPI0003641978|nr:peptide MFS transporter [Neolewinella persica]